MEARPGQTVGTMHAGSITRARSVARVVAAAAVAPVMSACLPTAVTDRGREVAWLYDLFMVAAAAVFVLVAGLIGWSVLRYRGEAGRDVAPPAAAHGNVALEVIWWALPTALVVVLIAFTWLVLDRVDARAEEPALTVQVEGFQWGWRFTYEEADVVVSGTAYEPPALNLPIGRTVAFVITSRDVVHSFNIPNFLIKRDAIPGRESRFDVMIELEGTYSGQCGEFCGLLHARQLFEIEAMAPDDFDSWIAGASAADR